MRRYCFTAVFASEMVGAASRLVLWNDRSSLDLTSKGGLAVYLFYSLIPTMLFTINLCGVKVGVSQPRVQLVRRRSSHAAVWMD